MEFELPIPPSSNNLFATYNGRRIISREYKAWRKDAGEKLVAQYAAYDSPEVLKPVHVRIRLNLNHQSDIGNREKAITDLLVAKLDMPDDRYIDRIVIERDRTIDAAVVTVGEGA
jgi:hypothetical protein